MASEAAPPASGSSDGTSVFTPVPYVVERRVVETADTVTMVLKPSNGHGIPPFAPGQFNMVYRFGVGEVPVLISGDPSHPDELVHTVRSAGKVTSALTKTMPGETLGVRGPYGVGWPLQRAEGQDVVIVGGLGLPPLRPLLYELLAHRERYSRVEIIYGARTPKDLVHYDEVQKWRSRGLPFQVTVDAAGRNWYGDVGLVTARIPDCRFDPAHTVVFLCGPEIMMRLSAQSLETLGVPEDAIWLSMERNMKCAVGLCGHCQWGPSFVCRDGPVFCYRSIKHMFAVREL